LPWRVIVWRTKFGVQFAEVRSSLVNPQQVLGLALDTRITSSKLADFGSKMAAQSLGAP
jgi:hypothetical protein